MKELFIIRGLPGSGKSTLAEQIRFSFAAQGFTASHYEADQFFIGTDGKYRYDRVRLAEVHGRCLGAAHQAMLSGMNVVVVANVFHIKDHMTPYIDIAKNLGYSIQIIVCQGCFGSIHNVPEVTLQRMKERFQYA